MNFLIQDGKSNYMEGLMLITLYLVIALACTSHFLISIILNRLIVFLSLSLGIIEPPGRRGVVEVWQYAAKNKTHNYQTSM